MQQINFKNTYQNYLAKVLAMMLALVIETIVDKAQTYAVLGRSIHEIFHLMRYIRGTIVKEPSMNEALFNLDQS